jgi:hypothetical protein
MPETSDPVVFRFRIIFLNPKVSGNLGLKRNESLQLSTGQPTVPYDNFLLMFSAKHIGIFGRPRYALLLIDENESQNPRVACQEICLEDGKFKNLPFQYKEGVFSLTS